MVYLCTGTAVQNDIIINYDRPSNKFITSSNDFGCNWIKQTKRYTCIYTVLILFLMCALTIFLILKTDLL